MTVNRKPTRYAHSDGHTDVCYSEDGSKLITCGTDGDIRIWSGFDDDDPVQTCVGEWSLSIRQKSKHLYIATDNNNVQLVTFPEGERDGILMRFTAHVNHLAVGKDHKLIGIASEDMEVKVMNLSDNKDEITTFSFTGLSGPPLSIAICPKGKIVGVSSGDGHLRLWDITSQTLLKDLECVPKTNSFMNAKLLCRLDFEPTSGRNLAYPDKNTVVIVSTNDWSKKQTLSCDAVDAAYSIIQYSPCGTYMAAASDKGDLVVWEISTQNLVGLSNCARTIAICAMVWNPTGNGEIAFCDMQGQLGIITNCRTESENKLPENDAREVTEDIQFTDDDDDADNENAVSLEKLKKEIMGTDEPELEFDGGASRTPTPRPRTPQIPLQATFMPSSTPEHLSPRYMCWNEVGIVRSYGSDQGDEMENNRSIEVEFHDSNLHNSMMMQNFQGYTMGSLSTTALAVANASQITVVPLSAASKEWNLTVAEQEEIVCVASSEHLVCFATTNYLIRVCTIYGTQKGVFSVPGPLVSMSCFGHSLLVAYHTASARKEDQCISSMLVYLEGTSVVSKDIHCALGPECTLLWLGFTDAGSPAIADSNGMLYLYPLRSNVWIPFCDTAKHQKSPADGFFVTAVFETFQSVRGIRCRGSVYPGFIPRPTLTELPLQPPFAEMSTEKSQLEANLFMWSALQVDNVDKKFKETALKTFALACKNNLDQRALEFIEMVANTQLLNLAVKYASKLNRQRLAERLVELASKMREGDVDDTINQSDITITTPDTHAIKPIGKKLVLSSLSKSLSKIKSHKHQDSPGTSNNYTLNGVAALNTSTNTQTQDASTSISGETNLSETVNTQESVFPEEEPKNPFLKSLKKPKTATYNPLSLTDKFAGYNVEKEKKEKENKSINEGTEKRKQPDSSDAVKQKEKQRRLDKFMFSKRF